MLHLNGKGGNAALRRNYVFFSITSCLSPPPPHEHQFRGVHVRNRRCRQSRSTIAFDNFSLLFRSSVFSPRIVSAFLVLRTLRTERQREKVEESIPRLAKGSRKCTGKAGESGSEFINRKERAARGPLRSIATRVPRRDLRSGEGVATSPPPLPFLFPPREEGEEGLASCSYISWENVYSLSRCCDRDIYHSNGRGNWFAYLLAYFLQEGGKRVGAPEGEASGGGGTVVRDGDPARPEAVDQPDKVHREVHEDRAASGAGGDATDGCFV